MKSKSGLKDLVKQKETFLKLSVYFNLKIFEIEISDKSTI